MNSKEFTYWLKGAIDLGKMTSLDKNETSSLRDYLGNVNNETTPLDSFPAWLKGYFEMADPLQIEQQDFRKIVNRLYSDLDKLNANTNHFDKAHDMSVYPPGVRAKC